MGVLGIIIQTEFGLPVYSEMFHSKLESFQMMDTSLTSGFITAMTMFAKQYNMSIGHIKLLKDVTEPDIYGVNMIAIKKGEYLILCFVEPYIYHEIVKEKIGWIYDRVLLQYEDDVRAGKVPTLTDEEKVYIEDILQDLYIRAIVAANKESIDSLLGAIFLKYLGIYGISINSFDNSILYFSGSAEETLKLFLNNLGRRSSIIMENEIIDSYVSLPDFHPVRVYVTNPGVKFEIQNILTNLPEKTVSLYYYIIVEPDLDIHSIVTELIEKLNPFFSK
ncbi:MAG TPA: hypothetical protein VMV49_02980 [Candidatus Deferrimicrobium sp.]|nr:hypothetical protein [Candidatus Deferrimicrobium sp.]